MGQLTLFEAAAAPKSLEFIVTGVVITLPAIIGHTVYIYRVFAGKATELSYE